MTIPPAERQGTVGQGFLQEASNQFWTTTSRTAARIFTLGNRMPISCNLQPTHTHKCKPVREVMLSKLPAALSSRVPGVKPSMLLSISQGRPTSWYWHHHLRRSGTSLLCAYQAVQSESLCQVLCLYCIIITYPKPDNRAGTLSIPPLLCAWVITLPHCSRMTLSRLFLNDFQDSSTSQVRSQQPNAPQRTQKSKKLEAGRPSWVPKADKTIRFNHANTSSQVEHIFELGMSKQTCHNRACSSNSTLSSFNRCTRWVSNWINPQEKKKN